MSPCVSLDLTGLPAYLETRRGVAQVNEENCSV